MNVFIERQCCALRPIFLQPVITRVADYGQQPCPGVTTAKRPVKLKRPQERLLNDVFCIMFIFYHPTRQIVGRIEVRQSCLFKPGHAVLLGRTEGRNSHLLLIPRGNANSKLKQGMRKKASREYFRVNNGIGSDGARNITPQQTNGGKNENFETDVRSHVALFGDIADGQC